MANDKDDDVQKKIEALEEENNFLKQIISHIPGNVYWKNKKGVYLGCNKNSAVLAGLKSEADIVGKTLYDFADGEVAKKIDKTDQKIMKGKKEVVVEDEWIDHDRKSAIYLSVKSPLFNQEGAVSGLLCVSVDITNIKRAEQALIEAKNKAEEMNRMKSEFIYSVEHDIRAPFSGIHAMSMILARQETDPDKKEALESIANSSKASLNYATRLLSYAKIEQEFNQVILKSFSISALIKSVIDMETPFAQAKGFKLITDISSKIPDMIISDPDRLKGILINLVSNSIKFTQQGFVKIEVVLVKKDKKNLVLNFSVQDTGVGISHEKHHFISEDFFRVNPHQQGLYPGFGLGFPVIKKFINELQGEIKIESSVGKGTTFSFTIPVRSMP
jgi:two-component system aerobic respiration control sensor histidine kinase ArcB